MTDPRALLDAYAATISHEGDYASWTIEKDAPAAFAALRAVLDKHKPFQYGDEDDEDEFDDPSRTWCKECTSDAWHRELYPCPTVQAITAALEADRGN